MPCPGAGVRNRKPAGLRNPRRGELADGKTEVFVRQLARARCPALRSAGLFGSETGSPRARAVQGTARVSSRGGGRRAEPGLRTSRQKEPAAHRLQQKRKNNALSGGPPHAQKLQQRAKKRQRASPCGGGRRAEPGLRTSRQEKPAAAAAKTAPAGAAPAQKKSPSEAPPLSTTKKAPGGRSPACSEGLPADYPPNK